MITVKNSKGNICDYKIPYDVNINDEVDNIQKLIDECKQKIIETTGIPKERLNKQYKKEV